MEHDDMLHWEKCSMAFTMARAEPADGLDGDHLRGERALGVGGGRWQWHLVCEVWVVWKVCAVVFFCGVSKLHQSIYYTSQHFFRFSKWLLQNSPAV